MILYDVNQYHHSDSNFLLLRNQHLRWAPVQVQTREKWYLSFSAPNHVSYNWRTILIECIFIYAFDFFHTLFTFLLFCHSIFLVFVYIMLFNLRVFLKSTYMSLLYSVLCTEYILLSLYIFRYLFKQIVISAYVINTETSA